MRKLINYLKDATFFSRVTVSFLEPLDIQNLFEKCLAGSEKARRELFSKYYSFGYAIAVRYSSSKEDAKEILSNAFIRVFKKLELFDSERPFESWFARIIINANSDFYRHKKPETFDLGNYEYNLESIDDSIIDKLNYEDLLSSVMTLSPQYRTVFNMYVIDGMKHHEIAEILNISVGTSKSNLNRAKAHLQKIITEKYNINV